MEWIAFFSSTTFDSISFTIPKILRPYCKNDKRLYGEVSKLIFELLSEFFSPAAQRELQCACVASYQSFGEFTPFHPPGGRFRSRKVVSMSGTHSSTFPLVAMMAYSSSGRNPSWHVY
jgi:hypothetical protein